ncbi:hypothetical protein PAXINDRAFT_90475, partial [Paxillus involutus ATCC 200175]
VLDGVRVPFTLLGFRVKSVFAQTTQDFADMLLMGSHVTREICKDAINKTLKGCRGIGEPEGHHQPFIGAIASPKSCFPFIPRSDADKVVSVTEVNLRVHLGPTQGI